MPEAIIIPSETEVQAAADLARCHGMNLYTNGERTVIAPSKPSKGLWAMVRVFVITPHRARLETLPCPA